MIIAEAIAVAAAELSDGVVARLGGPFGEAVRATRAALAALAPQPRKVRRAQLAAVSRAPVPPGLRGVHPSWIEAALAALPARTRDDLGNGGGDPIGVWLVRQACASIVPMPPVQLVTGQTAVTDLDAVLALPSAALESWLANVGAEQFAMLAICSKSVELVQRRPGEVGDRLRAAVARIWPFFRKDLLGYPVSEIAKRCADAPLEEHGLVRIGARTIAPYVAARPLAAEQLVLRLPRPIGTVVERELAAFARTSATHAPTWRVLSHVSVMPG